MTKGIIAVCIICACLVIALLTAKDPNDEAYETDDWRDRNG